MTPGTPEATVRVREPVDIARERAAARVQQMQTAVNNAGANRDTVQQQNTDQIKKEMADVKHIADAVLEQQLRKQESIIPDNAVKLAQQTIEPVLTTLEAVRTDVIKIPPRSRPVLTRLANDATKINEYNAPHLHNIIQKALDADGYFSINPANSPQQTQFEKDFELLKATNSFAARMVKDSILESIRRNEITGIDLALAEDKLKTNDDPLKAITEKSKQREDRGNTDDLQIINLLSTGEAEDKEALELFNAMESPKEFHRYYRGLVEHFISGHGNPPVQETPEKAARLATEEIQTKLIYLVHKIFDPIFDKDPNTPFDKLAQEAGNVYSNPGTQFNRIYNKLGDLGSTVGYKSEFDGAEQYFFMGNEEKVVFNGKQLVKDVVPSTEYKQGSFKEFLNTLHNSYEAERGIIEYGINFNYVMLKGGDPKSGSLFQQAAGYAQAFFPSARLDEMYKLRYGDMIEAAKIELSNVYKKEFAKARWVRDPKVLSILFSNLNSVEDSARQNLSANFANMPEWAVRRAFYHARTHLLAVDFMLNGLASYADPAISAEGEATYKDPVLKNLATYDAWEAAKQWRVSDTELKGVAWLPDGEKPLRKWIHTDAIKEGKKVYQDSFIMGDLSRQTLKNGKPLEYFDHDTNVFVAEGNAMKLGGVEVLSGWRLKWAYYPWIQDEVDINAANPKIKMGQRNVLVNSWKKLENLGGTVLNNFSNQFLFGPGNEFLAFQGDTTDIKNEARYEEFFKFVHRRYFSSGLGKELFPGLDTEDAFWKHVQGIIHQKEEPMSADEKTDEGKKAVAARGLKNRADALTKIMEKALTVVAVERTPLEFLFMENPRRSQNGITLMNEMQNHFMRDPVTKKIPDNKDENDALYREFDRALDDLGFVQQKARMDTIKEMTEMIQSPQNAADKNVFGDLSRDRSSLNGGKGYVVDEDYIRQALREKYFNPNNIYTKDLSDTDKSARVDKAVAVYKEMMRRLNKLPDFNTEINEETTENFKSARTGPNAWMKKRFEWAGGELFSGQTGLALNGDTAYQFLEFARTGRDMISRSAGYIGTTGEPYKAYHDPNAEEGFLSGVKDVARKGDAKVIVSSTSNLKTAIKQEDEDIATAMTRKNIERAVKILRRNSDCESEAGVLGYKLAHKKTSAAGAFVDEGPVHDLNRDGRYGFVSEFVQKAIIPKLTKVANREYTEVSSYEDAYRLKYGNMAGTVGKIRDVFQKPGTIKVRNRSAEISAEAIRSQAQASQKEVLFYHGLPMLGMVALAIIFLAAKEGTEEMKTSG